MGRQAQRQLSEFTLSSSVVSDASCKVRWKFILSNSLGSFHNDFLELGNYILKLLAEPVGSVAPKVDVKDRITWLDKPQGQALNLLCPAQSYPMPAYRY